MRKTIKFYIKLLSVRGIKKGDHYMAAGGSMVKIIRVYHDNLVKRTIRWLGVKTNIRLVKTKINTIKVKHL